MMAEVKAFIRKLKKYKSAAIGNITAEEMRFIV